MSTILVVLEKCGRGVGSLHAAEGFASGASDDDNHHLETIAPRWARTSVNPGCLFWC